MALRTLIAGTAVRRKDPLGGLHACVLPTRRMDGAVCMLGPALSLGWRKDWHGTQRRISAMESSPITNLKKQSAIIA